MGVRTCVILVNYKGSCYTSACLESLHNSSAVPRIAIVDNTPNDLNLLELLNVYKDVYLINASKNLGFSAGNNLGINWAMTETDCEFIFILNNDTTVSVNTISILESVLDNNPSFAIVTPRIVFMDNPELLWYGGGRISWARGSAFTPGFLGPSNAPLAMQGREVTFASGCALLIRRDAMKQLKGFNEHFFMYEEDVELCLRTIAIGWRIYYEPNALVNHVVQASSSGAKEYVPMLSPLNSNLNFYIYHVVRNRLINMRIHAKGYNYFIFILGIQLFLVKKIFHFALYCKWEAIALIFKGWYSYRKFLKDII